MIWLIISILIFIVFIFLLFSAFVGYKLVTPARFRDSWTPKDFGAVYEDVELRTSDGLKLKGWFIKGGERCVVLLHGYSVSRWDKVYMRPMMEELWKSGYSVLTFDFRAHGESQGKHTTIGDREFEDVVTAVNYARERCSHVYVVGYSMGGFLALKAATLDQVEKVVADSPYIYTDKTGARGLKYFANLPESLYAFVKPFAILISGANFKNTNPFLFVKDLRAKVLIVAGKKDPLVRVEEIKEFVEQSGKNIELWVTDAAHVRSIQLDREGYVRRVLEFLS
ncbi:alpha/beta hydrolase family protein [Aciduliprofundum sp. MAR08-339]|uniref:alpha/beta hydrolase n=1 Tax=Aciduliprofundum sp. (strain MAR08-339) TaxID=673860 RepID=UPI0002A47FB0|nr:alpha/beta hydrolase family protein [Aciduliprofundum sp. MAR08-339]